MKTGGLPQILMSPEIGEKNEQRISFLRRVKTSSHMLEVLNTESAISQWIKESFFSSVLYSRFFLSI